MKAVHAGDPHGAKPWSPLMKVAEVETDVKHIFTWEEGQGLEVFTPVCKTLLPHGCPTTSCGMDSFPSCATPIGSLSIFRRLSKDSGMILKASKQKKSREYQLDILANK